MSRAVPPQITLEEIRKLAMPLSAPVVSGEGLLDRVVTWATVIHPEDDLASKSLQKHELILFAPVSRPAKARSEIELVQWSVQARAAAIAFSAVPSPTALAEAKSHHLPVLTLPGDSRIRELERTIIRLLVHRQGQIERRGPQIYRQLAQISSRGRGLGEIVGAMARLTQKTVIVHDKRLRPLSHKLQPPLADVWDDIEPFLTKWDHLPIELHDRRRAAEVEPPTLMQTLPIRGLARLTAPIVSADVGRGFLSIIGREDDWDEIDWLVCEHGAAACALEMAKQKAVSETEKRLRGTFLDRLLLDDVSQREAIRQGERLQHDMTQTHLAIALSWRGEDPPSLRRLETLVNDIISRQQAPALVWIREKEGEVVVFYAADAKNPIDDSLALSQIFSAEIAQQRPENRLAVGLGQAAHDIKDWRVSYRDAVQAKELAHRLQTDIPFFIGDLGAYQLILDLSDHQKLSDFCEQTLGQLTDYDRRQKADLIKTLEAFFHCHGNLSKTAKALIVHRNTLLYRMSRISEIADIDLNRPETRLALHLALTIRRLLRLGQAHDLEMT